MPVPLTTPKVFISYSWTNPEHVEWVVQLATKLRSDQVDVVLDQWDLVEGQDLNVFMEQMVTDPEVVKVLAICDKKYAEKADSRKSGVGTETQIISQEVYSKVKQEKFIPILREKDDEGKACLPVYFRGRFYIDFTDDEKFDESYDRLLRNIHKQPERKKPPLGKAPAHLFNDETHVKTANKFERVKDAVQRGNARQLYAGLEKHFADPGSAQVLQRMFFFRSSMEEILNLRAIKHAAGLT